MNHYSETGQFEITLELTAHDLERVLETNGAGKLRLGSENEASDADKTIFDYVKKHFRMWANGGLVNWTFVGKEVKLDERIWIHFSGKAPDVLHSLKLKNDLLVTEFPKQQNKVNFESGTIKKTLAFSRLDTQKSITI